MNPEPLNAQRQVDAVFNDECLTQYFLEHHYQVYPLRLILEPTLKPSTLNLNKSLSIETSNKDQHGLGFRVSETCFRGSNAEIPNFNP